MRKLREESEPLDRCGKRDADILVTAANDWFRHRSAQLGAAAAYYSVFSLGPLLLIVTSIAGLFFGEDTVRSSLTEQFRALLGPTGSLAVEAMLKGASSPSSGRLTSSIGIVLLLAAGLGVVVQLKDALNTIWDVEEPEQGGWWWYLLNYLISLAGVLALGFLLAVSLVISTGLAALSAWIGGTASENIAWHASNFSGFACRTGGAFRHALQVVSGRPGRMGRCGPGGRGDRLAVQPREARHLLVYWDPGA